MRRPFSGAARRAGFRGIGSIAVSAAIPAPSTNAWFRYEANKLVTESASRVSVIGDQTAVLGNLSQAVGADQPLLVTGQLNGLPIVRFLASNTEYMQSGTIAAKTQPHTTYVVCKGLVNTVHTIMDGVGAAQRSRIGLTAGNAATAFAGTTLTTASTTWGGVWVAICTVYNGGSTAIYVNDFTTAKATGAGGAEGMDGVTLGVTRGLTGYFTGDWFASYGFTGAQDQTQRNAMRDYLNALTALGIV